MSNGDPCICGETETWHPECYHKQQEETNKQALADARNKGLREAAEIARDHAAKMGRLQCEYVAAILSSLSTPADKNERAM